MDQTADKDVKKLARGVTTTLIGKFGGNIITLLSQIAFARLLGPALFGLYAIGWTILRIVWVIAPLGLDNAVIQFGSRYWKKDSGAFRGLIIQSFGISISLSILLGITIFFLAPAIELFLDKPGLTIVLRIFSITYPAVVGLKIVAAATRVTQQMKFAVIAEDLSPTLLILVLFSALYLAGLNLVGAVVSSLIAYSLSFGLGIYYLIKLFPETLSTEIAPKFFTRALLSFSVPTAIVGTLGMFTTWMDRLFVSYYRPAADVGVYQVIAQSSLIFGIILSAFNTMFAPMIADLYNQGRIDRLGELFKVSTKWGLYLSLPVYLVFLFNPQELLAVVFGSEYVYGAFAMMILATAQLFNVGTGAVGFILIMSGHQYEWLAITVTTILLGIGINVLAIPAWGITGAAFSAAVSIIIRFMGGLVLVNRRLGLWPYDRRYAKGLVAILVTAGSMLALRELTVSSPVLALILNMVFSVGIFSLVLLVLGLELEDIALLQTLRYRLRSL